MKPSLGGFRAALLAGWILLGAAGVLYARFKNIPNWAALPVLAAFLIEYPFYLAAGFPEVRKRAAGVMFPLFLVLSVLLPYLVAYVGLGHLQAANLVKLAAVSLGAGLWFRLVPHGRLADLAFLAAVGAVLLSGFFDSVYPTPFPGLRIAYLGRIAWFRVTVLVLILERCIPETGYGFVPAWREWRIGIVHYLGFLPVAAALAFPLKAVRAVPPASFWVIAGTFLGFLWVVALFEEFLFRGVLQQWLEAWISNRNGALLLTSAIFGAAHLWFRTFPNWRWALIAGALGWFCGHARNQAGSIRAGVVTHALVVATWRGFFV